MSLLIALLLFLGLTRHGGDALSTGGGYSSLIAMPKHTTPTPPMIEIPSLTPAKSSLRMKSIIRAIVNGEWERFEIVLDLANETCALETKQAIYVELWQQLQQANQVYDPFKILDFYEQLAYQSNVPPALHENVYQAFLSRMVQLLWAPFHTDSYSANFPLITTLMFQLRQRSQDYTSDILEALFDAVLALESTSSVAQRLGNFNASLTQLTMANLQLLNRTEVQFNSNAHRVLLQNLRKLMKHPTYGLEVEQSLRDLAYAQLPSHERVLNTVEKICLRTATNSNVYLYDCPNSSWMCTRVKGAERMPFMVQRDANNNSNFAFQVLNGSHRYLIMASHLQPSSDGGVIRNVYSLNGIFWWHVEPVQDGVAIYDAATSGSIICGGDPEQVENDEHYVYTRRAKDFDAHREECTWIIEDCSSK